MSQTDNETRRLLILRGLALAAYPALIALAWLSEEPAWRSLGLPVLAIAVVGPPLTWMRAGVIAAATLLAGLVVLLPSLALWPPALILMALAGAFGLTLRPGKTPMIERFAHAVESARGQNIPAGANAWLRDWTWVWTLVLAFLGLVALGLSVADAVIGWLVWVVAVVPVTVVMILGLELRLRRQHFPAQPRWPLIRFMLAVARVRPSQLAP